jgi:hypothetical protein
VVRSNVNIHVGIANCQEFTIPAGKVLFLERAVVEYSTAPGGSGGATVRVTPLGSDSFEQITVPAQVDAPALQVDGNHPRYSGSVDIGLPVTTVSNCTRGSGVTGLSTVIGYVVPAG